MFASEAGGLTPGCTEKHSPWAWPSSWYGSWPRMTTRTCSYGVSSSALNMSSAGGYTTDSSRSRATNSVSA